MVEETHHLLTRARKGFEKKSLQPQIYYRMPSLFLHLSSMYSSLENEYPQPGSTHLIAPKRPRYDEYTFTQRKSHKRIFVEKISKKAQPINTRKIHEKSTLSLLMDQGEQDESSTRNIRYCDFGVSVSLQIIRLILVLFESPPANGTSLPSQPSTNCRGTSGKTLLFCV
ncbi:hypothetical protein BD289DRAFT_219004 [Coniella lustricola]|uniref:Uncharacterized protein n=1 Tax=Coniella lustricola TaxID=2025994 RepID=A0A2T3ALS3_9PEZI|nr:hypothetical protein BD289DRAFT_219004 [Coniella lustricola]